MAKTIKVPEPPRLAINQKEFAQRIGVSVPTARALMNQRGFPSIKCGRNRLIPVKALDEWLEEQAQKGGE